ncbi:MAG: cation transporter [Desulfobacteraceae bacterium IS3]|nr:MAG: cation transporter [Desulfobacteraceae bacterium IS3]
MRPHIILRYIGVVLVFNAVFLSISAIISAANRDSSFLPLFYSSVITLLFGAFPLIFVPPARQITNKEGFMIVMSSWLLSCLVGVIPYVLWGGEFSFANAWFESVSGFTTTGATVLNDVEALPKGLLFWRASTHWIGGIGIVVFMLSVLPAMGSARMVLYRNEMSSLAMDNFRHSTARTLQILLVVYVGLTVLETVLLTLCGMTLFDALTHSFATIATGGFSTKNLSVAAFDNLAVEVIIMIFMILSGIHFGLLFNAITESPINLWKSSVVKYYLLSMGIGIAAVTVNIHGSVFPTWGASLRYASFQLLSVGTSTGFATADSAIWPPFAQMVMIFFILQCSCAGSTSGGIKADRVVIFWKSIIKRIKKIQHPSAVVVVKVNNEIVQDDVIEMSVLYIALYITIVFITSVLLTAMGVDSLSAFSGSAATMGNVGPGFGTVSSLGNFSQIPDPGKWILSVNMLLGRVEIFGLILLLTARSWK